VSPRERRAKGKGAGATGGNTAHPDRIARGREPRGTNARDAELRGNGGVPVRDTGGSSAGTSRGHAREPLERRNGVGQARDARRTRGRHGREARGNSGGAARGREREPLERPNGAGPVRYTRGTTRGNFAREPRAGTAGARASRGTQIHFDHGSGRQQETGNAEVSRLAPPTAQCPISRSAFPRYQ
jgi:hypothetical protein